MTVRETDALVARLLEAPRGKPTPAAPDANIKQLETTLSSTLGAPVKIQHGRKGRGKLIVAYNSLDELDGILAHIK